MIILSNKQRILNALTDWILRVCDAEASAFPSETKVLPSIAGIVLSHPSCREEEAVSQPEIEVLQCLENMNLTVQEALDALQEAHDHIYKQMGSEATLDDKLTDALQCPSSTAPISIADIGEYARKFLTQANRSFG